MMMTGKAQSTRRKNCHSATLPTTYLTRIGMGSNQGLHGKRPATDVWAIARPAAGRTRWGAKWRSTPAEKWVMRILQTLEQGLEPMARAPKMTRERFPWHAAFTVVPPPLLGRDSSVGIATRYGLDGPGIESRWEGRFSAPVQTGPGAHPASYTMGTGSFLGVKRPGSGSDHPPPSSAEVKEGDLYLYSTSGPSWPVIGWTLSFLFLLTNQRFCIVSNTCTYIHVWLPTDCNVWITVATK